MTSQVLPELAKLLGSLDEHVVLEAARLIMELSKKEASCRAIVASEMLVSSLIKAMASTGNAELHKSISGTLHNVSNDRYVLALPHSHDITMQCVLLWVKLYIIISGMVS